MTGCTPHSGQYISEAVAAAVLDDIWFAYGVTPEEVVGQSRAAKVVRARQAAMWVLRQRIKSDGTARHSLLEIGRVLGGRDHATVIHGIRAHKARISAEAAA